MNWNEEAERILTAFPDNWSPSCKQVTDAVAAALAAAEAKGANGKRGRGIVYWKTYAAETKENWKIAVDELDKLRDELDEFKKSNATWFPRKWWR